MYVDTVRSKVEAAAAIGLVAFNSATPLNGSVKHTTVVCVHNAWDSVGHMDHSECVVWHEMSCFSTYFPRLQQV